MSDLETEAGFTKKLGRVFKRAGREVVEKALWLWYAAQNPNTPKWAKAAIWSALLYLVLPVDAIPDFLPALGYTDDLGVLAAALVSVASYVDDNVKERARAKMGQFGLESGGR